LVVLFNYVIVLENNGFGLIKEMHTSYLRLQFYNEANHAFV